MSSILTNSSAMVALQTLRNTNMNLGEVQGQIATGKKVASASDNSALWSISKVMEFDISGFEAIKEGLGMAEATLSVTISAGDQIIDVLNDMKQIAIGAMSEGADFAKARDELDIRADQIADIAKAAQFNGINLLATDKVDGSTATGANTSLTVVTSLNRQGSSAPTVVDMTLVPIDTTANGGTTSGFTAITNPTFTSVATAGTYLNKLETNLQEMVDQMSTFGAQKNQVEMQKEFLTSTIDAMKMGVSSLVDADMEEASARLQALQTQQQLGIQALSIANQQSQALLQLFR